MGRHTDPADIGSRRAMVLTLTASALLVLAGVAVLRSAGDLHLGRGGPPTPTATSTIGQVSVPGPAAGTSPRPSTPVASAPTTSPSGLPSATGQLPATVRDDLARQVVTIVNAERARAGCDPVAPHDALVRAAQQHSADMAARAYFSHTSPEGLTFSERVRAAGWAGGALAENIAAGQGSAVAVMKDWMGSAAHRANILNCAYRDIGVGYATGGRYGTYWTQTFGA